MYWIGGQITYINDSIRNGGGIGDVLGDVAPGDSTYIGRFFFDLTFFLIIIILGLNIVFGIILDTFGQLRDQKSVSFMEISRNNSFSLLKKI